MMKFDIKTLIYLIFLAVFYFFYGSWSVRHWMCDIATITKFLIILLATSCEINQIEITNNKKETMKYIIFPFIHHFCLLSNFRLSFILRLKSNIWSNDKTKFLRVILIIWSKLIKLEKTKKYKHSWQAFLEMVQT